MDKIDRHNERIYKISVYLVGFAALLLVMAIIIGFVGGVWYG